MMEEDEPIKVTFEDAVMDTAKILGQMKRQHGIPPATGLDVIRLQMMYMEQSNREVGTRVPPDAPPEVIAAEQYEAQDDE